MTVTGTLLPEPLGTVAMMLVGEAIVKDVALVLPNLTAVTSPNPTPVRVIVAPFIAEFGVIAVIVGAE